MSDQPSLFTKRIGVRTSGRSEVAGRTVRQILHRAAGALAGFDYTLNPYVGCQFACSYCYAAFFVPDDQRRETWGAWVDVKENAPELIDGSRGLGGKRILIGSATDAYQPIEKQIELTRRVLEALLEVRPQPIVTIQTRSPLVCRDVDLLQRFERLTVGMSITTDSEPVRLRFEPACASLERRFETLDELRRAGIPISVSVAPMLPLESPRRFAERLQRVQARRYWAGWFHASERPFSASTRPEALRLAAMYRWDHAAYRLALAEMRRVLPQIAEYGSARSADRITEPEPPRTDGSDRRERARP